MKPDIDLVQVGEDTDRGGRSYKGLCVTCGGMCLGDVSLLQAKWHIDLPSRCSQKDICQSVMLSKMDIEPIRDTKGIPVRAY